MQATESHLSIPGTLILLQIINSILKFKKMRKIEREMINIGRVIKKAKVPGKFQKLKIVLNDRSNASFLIFYETIFKLKTLKKCDEEKASS